MQRLLFALFAIVMIPCLYAQAQEAVPQSTVTSPPVPGQGPAAAPQQTETPFLGVGGLQSQSQAAQQTAPPQMAQQAQGAAAAPWMKQHAMTAGQKTQKRNSLLQKAASAAKPVAQVQQKAVPVSASSVYDRPSGILPEVTTPVDMSSSDINRVTCPPDLQVSDVVFSQEKAVKVKYTGGNAYIKFLFSMKDGVEEYATKPVEFYVVCGQNVYNLIASPKRIPSQTIRLSTGKMNNIKDNTSLMGGLPWEKKISMLIKLTATDTIPDSFDVSTPNKVFRLFKELQVILHRVVLVEGEGLRLKEYYVRNKIDKDAEDGVLNLNESDFLSVKLTTNTLAVALDKLSVNRGETAKLFIVESTGDADHVN